MDEKTYSMKEIVHLTGISKDTILYYEKIGVLATVARNQNNYRQFSADDLDWLNLVKLLRAIKIPVKDLIGGQQTSLAERQIYLKNYSKTIEQEIEQLQAVQKLLTTKLDYLATLTETTKEK